MNMKSLSEIHLRIYLIPIKMLSDFFFFTTRQGNTKVNAVSKYAKMVMKILKEKNKRVN